MHEIKVAENMMQIILDVAREESLGRVNQVNVQFGKMIQIVPDIFRFAFEEVARGTIAEGAILDLEILLIKMQCLECGREFTVDDNQFDCPVCESDELKLVQGRETVIKSIEGEKE